MPDVNETAFDPMKDVWIPNPIDTSSVELPPELDEVIEAAAKAEHEAYVAGRLAEGKSDDLTVPWEDLTEEYRESSRHGVSEAMKVMMVNGYTFEPTAEGTVPMTEEQKNALDNVIAYNAHDVWGAERIAAGWTYGPEKDAEKKTNPTLVPYESLSESETEYDRNFARSTVDNLNKAGLSVVPPVQEQDITKEVLSDIKDAYENKTNMYETVKGLVEKYGAERTQNVLAGMVHSVAEDNRRLGDMTWYQAETWAENIVSRGDDPAKWQSYNIESVCNIEFNPNFIPQLIGDFQAMPSNNKEWLSLINHALKAEHPEWDKSTVYKMTAEVAEKMDKLPLDRVTRQYDDKNKEQLGKVNLIMYAAHPDWTPEQVYKETPKVVNAMRGNVAEKVRGNENKIADQPKADRAPAHEHNKSDHDDR